MKLLGMCLFLAALSLSSFANAGDPALTKERSKTDTAVTEAALAAVAKVAATKTEGLLKNTEAFYRYFSKELAKSGITNAQEVALEARILELAPRLLLHRAVQTSAVGLAALAGYTAGQALVEYDKNHWDGKMMDSVARDAEPVFAQVYRIQQKLQAMASTQ